MNRNAKPSWAKTGRGFTLIELMITVAIVAILAAVAYPSYQDQVRKSRRADAMTALTNAAQLQERNFTRTGSYLKNDNIAKLGGDTSPEGYYTIETDTPNTAACTRGTKYYCFTLTATAKGTQASDSNCKTFILNEKGDKTSKNAGGTATTDCW